MRINKSALIVIGVGIVLTILLFVPLRSKEKMNLSFREDATLKVTSPDEATKANFKVQFAKTAEAIDQGLRFRKKLNAEHGMLFITEEEEVQSFWMFDMLFPIDIIYIDAEREIVYIAKDMPIDFKEPVPALAPSQYVLQINGGLSDQYNISVGDRVTWTPNNK
jgi:uncharacterized membrane protein (UPF0127 family)